MSSADGPPGYAWDWVARQRLVWREAHSRLGRAPDPAGARYRPLSAKPEVLSLLRRDYPQDDLVREVVRAVVDDLVFLRRTDRPFAELRLTTAPRGLRWWWSELTGERIVAPPPRPSVGARQLDFEDILEGYGDPS